MVNGFDCIFSIADPFATKLSLITCYYQYVEMSMQWKDWNAVFKGKVTRKVKKVNECLSE